MFWKVGDERRLERSCLHWVHLDFVDVADLDLLTDYLAQWFEIHRSAHGHAFSSVIHLANDLPLRVFNSESDYCVFIIHHQKYLLSNGYGE